MARCPIDRVVTGGWMELLLSHWLLQVDQKTASTRVMRDETECTRSAPSPEGGCNGGSAAT